jgi:hypothetical protein
LKQEKERKGCCNGDTTCNGENLVGGENFPVDTGRVMEKTSLEEVEERKGERRML